MRIFLTRPLVSSITSRRRTSWRSLLGTSMPTVFLPGIGRHDADAGHAQGDGQVVGQAGDFRQPQAGFELDFELGDDRAGFDFDDFDFEAEIEERLFQHLGFAADFFFVLLQVDAVAGQAVSRAKGIRNR